AMLITSLPPNLFAQAINSQPRQRVTQENEEVSRSSGLASFLYSAFSAGNVAALSANRSAPDVQPPPLYPVFSSYFVTDEEIMKAHVFEERLVPIGERTSFEENRALADAITSYLHHGGG